jgi:GNAT superfamily N-acetyltransferase
MSEPFHYEEFRGAEIAAILEELGRLRIAVFREYPYLYDGDLDYEKHYLETYVRSARSLVVLLRSGERVVGATTCLPMADESPEFQAPLLEAGYDLEEVFYLGESIILPEFRGRGAGHEFFKRREAQARDAGPFRFTAFCSVDRPADHPSRPPGYETLDSFWTRMGYRKSPGLKCELEWKEIGEETASSKPLTFWMKEWR